MSYSTLQEGLRHFVMPGVGYLAYSMMPNGPDWLPVPRTALVLADPVAAPAHWRAITEAFLVTQATCPMFAQVGRDYAQLLRCLGFRINCFGGETELDMATSGFSGKKKIGLRSTINAAQRAGLTVTELDHVDAATAAELAAVDAAWCKGKGGKAGDVWLLNRRPELRDEPGVRKFVVRDADGRMGGFIFFDPMHRDGQLVGYYANVTRMDPAAHPGTLNLLMKEVVEKLRREAAAGQLRGSFGAQGSKVSSAGTPRSSDDSSMIGAASTGGGGSSHSSNHISNKSPEISSVAASDAGGAAQAGGGAAAGQVVLSLGMAPMWGMHSEPWMGSDRRVERVLLMGRDSDIANWMYPCHKVAASKTRYGGHLDLQTLRYTDPAAEWKPVYLAHKMGGSRSTAFLRMYNLFRHVGFYNGPLDSSTRCIRHMAAQSARRARARLGGAARAGGGGAQPEGPRGGKGKGAASVEGVGSTGSVTITVAGTGQGPGGRAPSSGKPAAAAPADARVVFSVAAVAPKQPR